MNLKKLKESVFLIIICAAGMIILSLMMPLMLAIVLNGMIFAVPFFVYEYCFKNRIFEKGREKGAVYRDRNHDASGKKHRQNIQSAEKDHRLSEKLQSVQGWYSGQGKRKLQTITEELNKKGICECWIRKDGICNIRTPKGYRRAGILPGFPNEAFDEVWRVLRSDGWRAERQRQYIYLEWKKG